MALRCCAARSSCLLRRSTSSNSSSHKVAARHLHRSKHVAKPEGVGPAAPNAKVPFGAGEQGYTVFAGVMVAAAIGLDAMQDFKLSRDLYRFAADSIALPLLRLLDAEKAHELSVKAASLGLAPSDHSLPLPELQTTVFGLNFPNVVGLAAGFDKNAEAVDGLLDTGFGFVEIGSVTPLPQPGNPKPRMFRLTEDRAVINRCGFNSDGAVAVEERLKRRAAQLQRQQAPAKGLVGINVGKNKWVPEEKAAEDYCAGIRALAKYGDYIVVNVSSPNTPGLRLLQRREAMAGLIKAAAAERDAVLKASGKRTLPLLVKIAPDLDEQQKRDIADIALSTAVDGLIVSNTTISRPASLQSEHKTETGGLSGLPVRDLATATVADMYRLTQGRVPIVGVGGVQSGQDAYDKIRAGASLVQVYSMMVYAGPGMVQSLKKELGALLQRDGYASVSEAVGAAHRESKQ